MTHYGIYGGQYVPETLIPTLAEIDAAFRAAQADPAFHAEYDALLRDYVGRESPLYLARRLSDALGGARIYLKREDLNHTGAHKINNVIGQALLARRMGKTRLIAETGAGMHGVATATVAALFGLPCEVYMGAVDVARQAPNVDRMRALGATVHAVESGSRTLKDAMNEAIRDWAASAEHTFYVIGTVAGPAPYPEMVRTFQSVIGTEARRQCLEKTGRLPDEVIACVGGGSNAMGIFSGFLGDKEVRLTGVEAGGYGLASGEHAASINGGSVGVLHGCKTKLLQTPEGQVIEAYSASAGLDYPGVGPEHCFLADTGRVRYAVCDDAPAIRAFDALCRYEGIIPALESSHALAEAIRLAPTLPRDAILVVCLSGRGDKDMGNIAAWKAAHPEFGREDAKGSGCSALTGRSTPCRADTPSFVFSAETPCGASGGRGREGEARPVSAQPEAQLASLRLKKAFARAEAEGRPTRVFFMTVGFPSLEESEAVMEALVEGGADVLELGVPFSDPIADGAVIQAASQQALRNGVTVADALALAGRLRAKHPDLGLVLFSYCNPLLAYGVKRLCSDAAAAGVDGLLAVDVPYEEEGELRPFVEAAGLSWVPLISPATTPERAARLTAGCDGFAYVITTRGITGERKALPPELADRLTALRTVTDLPLAAGFGIADATMARAVGQHAQGVVIGSAAVRALTKGGLPGLREWLRPFAP